MAWPANYPPTSDATVDLSYPYLLEFRKAIRERALVMGNDFWPHSVNPWDNGIITGITATSLTDSTKAWATAPKQWVSFTTGAVWLPVNYDVVIGSGHVDDPHQIIRVQIQDNSATVLTIGDITNWVTAGYITSIAALVGKPYSIIRRDGQYYPWWHQRWPRRPNDHKLYRGTMTSSPAPTTTGCTVTDAGWTIDQFAGKAFFGFAGGLIVKVTIASNTADTLTWSAQSWTPAGDFEIQASTSSVCWPGYVGDLETAWYRGYMTSAYTHLPDDVISTVSKPATSITYTLWDGFACSPETSNDVFDRDFLVDFQEECSDRDKHFAINMFKNPRGLQVWLEGACLSWLPARWWNGTGYDAIDYEGTTYFQNFTPATWFQSENINYHGTFSDTSDGSGVADFSITGLPTPAPNYHYAVLKNAIDEVVAFGTSSSSTLTVTGLAITTAYRCVVSLGWTRAMPANFRYLDPSTRFEPDTNAGSPVVPPTTTYPGSWVTNDASTAYIEYTSTDTAGGDPVEVQAFVNGDKGRWVGDRWQDLGVAGVPGGDTADPLNDYRVYGAVRNHLAAVQATIDAQTTGTATAGSTTHLVTASQDWWVTNWYSGGTLIQHDGTATGGSTTTLIDTGKSGSAFWNGGGGRWVGHCIEIEVSAGVWEQRLCTGYVAGTQTITVAPAWSVTASGKVYRIREPAYHLNRWKGRKVTIIDPSGPTTYTTTITGSTDTHLFFTAIGAPVAAGWTFEIDNPKLGSVFNRTSGAWVVDANPLSEEPDVLTRYGRYGLNDYIGTHVQEELYRGINALRWTLGGVAWHNYDASLVSEDNRLFAARFGSASEAEYYALWAIVVTEYETVSTPDASDGPAPYAVATGEIHYADSASASHTLSRLYAFGHKTVPTVFASEIDFYVFAYAPNYTSPDLSAFDDNGDDVVEDIFHLFGTVTPIAGLAVTSQLGSIATPANPATFPGVPAGPPDTIRSSWRGYLVGDAKTVVRWDVGGGLTYVD